MAGLSSSADSESSLPATLPHLLQDRARRHGDRAAVTFVSDDGQEDVWTYADLWRSAEAVAAGLRAVGGIDPADPVPPRALLLYPPGVEFLASFLGCQVAGWIPVPTCYPKPGRELPRLDSAATDCQPAAIVGLAATLDELAVDKLSPSAARATLVAAGDRHAAETVIGGTSGASERVGSANERDWDPDAIAFLQYTSGSTNDPKGVRVRHRNLIANLEAIRIGFGIDFQDDESSEVERGVFWLPFYHDMGLIGGILEPLYVGGHSILISPQTFLRRPIRWLQTISDYGALISGAPNFAYQLCADRISASQAAELDLSGWKVAFCGAEPVLPHTLDEFTAKFSAAGFSDSSFYPCYGLAEATLLAAGGEGPARPVTLRVDRRRLGEGVATILTGESDDPAAEQRLVVCGNRSHRNEVRIVDPQSRQTLPADRVGEIWLRGESISDGYWNRDVENAEQFQATTAEGESGFCRTGDLGFVHGDHLAVTGRIKDVIILRGRNLFPQDIEASIAEKLGPEFGKVAAFAVATERAEALAILVEIPRRPDESTFPTLCDSIRRQVIETHEVDPRHIWLVRQASVPLTSSGKVQRNRCRERFEADQLTPKYRFDRTSVLTEIDVTLPELSDPPTADERTRLVDAIEDWMVAFMTARGGVAEADIDIDRPFAEYGLDSLTAVELSGELEEWTGVDLNPVVAWNYPTIVKMAEYIATQLITPGDVSEAVVATNRTDPADVSEAELELLLDEIEGLSDDEIDHALADKQQP